MRLLHELWYGRGPASDVARGALAPASWLFGVGVRIRNVRFNRPDATVSAAIPLLSLGNITVGGTGKTPVAAWAAEVLRTRGAHPAILMRGYGDDEPLVHARLNPLVPVIVNADRAAGALDARMAGADCGILDDGFQHRGVSRVSDWVLVAVEQWRRDLRLLPAGPLREPASALHRADVVLVTRKSGSLASARQLAARLGRDFPRAGVALCHLRLGDVMNAQTNDALPPGWLEGRALIAVAALGAPDAFFAQLRASGAQIDARAYRDHHRFTDAEIAGLAAEAGRGAGLICTLKDAVKLSPRWPPAAATLWYVSQNVVIEDGEAVLDRALETVLAARPFVSSTAG